MLVNYIIYAICADFEKRKKKSMIKPSKYIVRENCDAQLTYYIIIDLRNLGIQHVSLTQAGVVVLQWISCHRITAS